MQAEYPGPSRMVGMVTELRQGVYLRMSGSFFEARAIGRPEGPVKLRSAGITKGPLTVGARRVDRERKRQCNPIHPPRPVRPIPRVPKPVLNSSSTPMPVSLATPPLLSPPAGPKCAVSLAGGGVITAKAAPERRNLARKANLPATMTLKNSGRKAERN